MATILIDDRPYTVTEGNNLLHECLSLGFDLPYFCWHPALGSVGACRQCAIKQFKGEQDTRGKIVMACMTPVVDGARISIEDPEAHEFRASVTEWLMVNHPHDCPVCDEGGECHLQDMTVMTGHVYRHYRGKKRTFRNQDLGPLVNHEMNRCIQCYRCVRFYREYAGGRDLDAFALRNVVYFGRQQDGVLENEFSGNLVEVCPTGVFTDKTLKQHYTRKWDLETAPSVCVHCGLGCNTIPGARYGTLRRILNRYNGHVNGYFICDRGRYGYEFVNSDMRIRRPLLHKEQGGEGQAISREEALQHLASMLPPDAKAIGIGSPRASLEANFALRTLVGPERFFLGVSEREADMIATVLGILRNGPARAASLHDAEQADAVLVLGEDLTNTAPRLALALRQAVRNAPMKISEKLRIPAWDDHAVREAVQDAKGPLFIATVASGHLDDVATQTFHGAPDGLARLGFAVAHALDPKAPTVAGLPDSMQALIGTIATALREAERPLIVSGTSSGSSAIIQAAANVAWVLCNKGRAAQLCFVMPECNSLGLGLIGGQGLEAAVDVVRESAADTVIILENDLYRRADATAIDALLENIKHVVAIDHLAHATTAKAEIVLPGATFAEADGTMINNEGRAQRFFQVFIPDGDIQESWRWLRDISEITGRTTFAWRNLDEITATCAQRLPVFKPIIEAAPPSDFRVAGEKIPREPHRYSGRTAMCADINVHEPKTPDDPDSALAFSMEGYYGRRTPSPLIPFYWAPGWNSVQALNKFQSEVGGPLQGGDPGVRLIEPAPGVRASYITAVPAPFKPRRGEWLIVPLHHIFGSEELSVLTPGIAELSPAPYIALNPRDADDLGIKAGEEVGLSVTGLVRRLAVQIRDELPRGVAGVPVGLDGMAGVALPQWGTLSGRSRPVNVTQL